MIATLVGLTEATTKSKFYIDAQNIRLVTRSDKNQLVTLISTYVMTPQGPQGFEVLESPEEAARLINAGRLGKDTLTN